MKYHVVKKDIACIWPSSLSLILIIAYFSNDDRFTMKLSYETAAKLVQIVLNFLFTVPARDVPSPITAKPDTESVIIK